MLYSTLMAQQIDVTLKGLHQLSNRIHHRQLNACDWPVVDALVDNLIGREEGKLTRMLAKLANQNSEQEMKAGAATATADLTQSDEPAPEKPAPELNTTAAGGKKGHGRNAAVAFSNAKQISYVLPKNTIGFFCQDCGHGRMKRYRSKKIICVIGQPLFAAEIHEAEQARCPGCGKIISAPLPAKTGEGIGKHVIYHWSAAAMLLVLHYTGGMPFKRLELLHSSWGIPFSDANQWEVVNGAIDYLMPLLKAIENHAIENVQTLKIDDTGSMVLEIQQQITAEVEAAKALGLTPENIRTGINATCARMETPDGTVLLFFTGRHHAGEICERILDRRPELSEKIIKITDAAAKNFNHNHADKVIEAACNAHAFLKFRAIKAKFPDEYALVGEAYKHIFENDDTAREQKMTPQQRLEFHQQHSRKWMEKIRQWCADKLQDRSVEPRSALWEPVTFIINQWPRLSKFLEGPGVPLDTNLVEQALNIPVRYLAGSFNYQNVTGAEVGDAAMSLVSTARACDVEPVSYITYCLEHHQDLKLHPEKYLPWVYRDKAKDRIPDELIVEIR